MTHANPLIANQNDLRLWLPLEVRDQMAALEEQKIVPAGTRLVDPGGVPTHLMILNSGTVEVSLPDKTRTISLGIAGSGSVFDLRSLVSGTAPCIQVVCREECRLTMVPREDFMRLLQQNPRSYFAVAKVLSSDLKAALDTLRRMLSAPRGLRRARPGGSGRLQVH